MSLPLAQLNNRQPVLTYIGMDPLSKIQSTATIFYETFIPLIRPLSFCFSWS